MMMSQRICLVSQKLLSFALKFSSVQFQDWGQAMAAELQTIEKPIASLFWSIGCVCVVLREGIPGKLRRFWSDIVASMKEGRVMRDARITASAAVVVTLLLVAFTHFRQAMSVAAESLIRGPLDGAQQPAHIPIPTAELDEMRKQAERDKDAKLLTYVAINDTRPELARAAADEAISIDPQWTWVYYVLANHKNSPEQKALIAKLEKWDPDNAANYLLEADLIPAPVETNLPLSGNEPWLSAEAHALSFPKFDSYSRQHFNLVREVIMKRGGGPFEMSREFFSHPCPWLIHLQAYAVFVERSPSLTPAESKLQAKHLVVVGEQMMNDTTIVRLIGASIATKGYEKLSSSPEEAAYASARLEQIHATFSTTAYPWLEDTLAANAVTVQLCFIAIVASSLAMCGSFLGMLFRRTKALRIVLWISSALMMTSCIVGYVSYLPFARLWKELASNSKYIIPPDNLLFAFNSFFAAHYFATTKDTSLALYGWNCVVFVLFFALLSALIFFAARNQQWQRVAPTA